MDPLPRIVALLQNESPRKRIAAAVVLGELGVRSPAVVKALSAMARDTLEALAEPAVEALGKLGTTAALPVLLEAWERKELRKAASGAIAALGEEALPALREKLSQASPEARAALSGLLPAVRGSFAMVLDGLRGQPWDVISNVALSFRQSARAASPAERKPMAARTEAFLRKVRDDEPALRGALKILGYLEQPSSAKKLEAYLGSKYPAAVRVEAITALRFALAAGKPPPKALLELLEDPDPLVARAARDTLTLLPVPTAHLARFAGAPNAELALWAIERLGAAGGARELAEIARGKDRGRAEAAVRVLSPLPGAGLLLADALAQVTEEAGAHALAEALERVALTQQQVAKLRAAGTSMLRKSLAVARRQLEPVRRANPQDWAQVLRDAARKADAGRAEAIYEMLVRSPHATLDDRYAHASLLLRRSSLDPHPRARHADPALVELEKLAADGFALAAALEKDKRVGDEARYHVGFHFAEHTSPEVRAVGVSLLEGLSTKGRGKLPRAARNKLGLLRGG